MPPNASRAEAPGSNLLQRDRPSQMQRGGSSNTGGSFVSRAVARRSKAISQDQPLLDAAAMPAPAALQEALEKMAPSDASCLERLRDGVLWLFVLPCINQLFVILAAIVIFLVVGFGLLIAWAVVRNAISTIPPSRPLRLTVAAHLTPAASKPVAP